MTIAKGESNLHHTFFFWRGSMEASVAIDVLCQLSERSTTEPFCLAVFDWQSSFRFNMV